MLPGATRRRPLPDGRRTAILFPPFFRNLILIAENSAKKQGNIKNDNTLQCEQE